MRSTLLFLVLCVLVWGGAQAVPFKECGDVEFVPTSVEVQPDPPVIGRKLVVIIKGRAPRSIQGGRFYYTASVHLVGKSYLKLAEGSEDLCQYTDCPIEAGSEVVVTYSLYLPPIIPEGKYKVEITAEDTDGVEVLCVEVELHLTKPKERVLYSRLAAQ